MDNEALIPFCIHKLRKSEDKHCFEIENLDAIIVDFTAYRPHDIHRIIIYYNEQGPSQCLISIKANQRTYSVDEPEWEDYCSFYWEVFDIVRHSHIPKNAHLDEDTMFEPMFEYGKDYNNREYYEIYHHLFYFNFDEANSETIIFQNQYLVKFFNRKKRSTHTKIINYIINAYSGSHFTDNENKDEDDSPEIKLNHEEDILSEPLW